MYEFGVGVEKDIEQASDLLERAAKLGTPSGQLELAYFLQRHPKAASDKARSLGLFRSAANTGFAKARAHYASVLMTGDLVPNTLENYNAGLDQLRLAAKSDYPYAMYALALQGNAVEQRQWRSALDKLAATGDADAHHWLCEIAMDGQDYMAAQRHCTIAATAGYADAQARLALAAFNGLGRRKSPGDALHWMRQALSDPALDDVRCSLAWRSSLSKGLVTYSSAPASNALWMSTDWPFEVQKTTLGRKPPSSRLSAATNSMPVITGMSQSSSTRLGISASQRLSASAPFSASMAR